MPVLTTIELFYALLVLVVGYGMFRWLARTNLVNEIADQPIPEGPQEPTEEIIHDFEVLKTKAVERIETTDAQIERMQARGQRLREQIKPLPPRNPSCTETKKKPSASRSS